MSQKQTIIITPYKGVTNPILVPSYTDNVKKKTVILDNRYHVHFDKLPPGVTRFAYSFDAKSRPILKIEWDWSDDDKVNQIEIPFQKHAKDFFMNHPNIEVVGYKNNNLRDPLFTMFVVEDGENYDHVMFELRLRVMNIIYNLSDSKRRDIAYYFGMNPAGMNDKKLLLALVGLAGGALLVEEKAKEFIRLMENPENKEALILTIVRKAILMGKVTFREGKYYGFGDDAFIGTNEKDVFKFYFENEKMYNFLVKEVGISDFSKDRIEIKKEVEVEKGLSSKELKDRAKELNIQGWFTMSPEKLKIAIEEHELSKK